MFMDTGPIGNIIASVAIGALPGSCVLAATIDHYPAFISWPIASVVAVICAGFSWAFIERRKLSE